MAKVTGDPTERPEDLPCANQMRGADLVGTG
jgi:hypothetical protein